MKKILSIVVTIVVSTVSIASVWADQPVTSPVMSPRQLSGQITRERERAIEVHSQAENKTVVLNITEDTYIIDAVTGGPTSLEDRKNDAVSVYYGPAETRSLPPQSNAVAIICNIPQDYSPLHYTLVEDINKSGSGAKVTTNDGSLIVTIPGDLPISAYNSGRNVTVDEIEQGGELLLWYAMVAMSYPGQATATKAVFLEKGVDVPEDEMTMVPLRATAEANGYSVDWDHDSKSIAVSDEEESYILTLGSDKCGDVQLEAAPELRDSVTYVPSTFFTEILGIDI